MALEFRRISTSQGCSEEGLVLTRIFGQREAAALLSGPDSGGGADLWSPGKEGGWPGHVAGVVLKADVLLSFKCVHVLGSQPMSPAGQLLVPEGESEAQRWMGLA